jgi:P-type E1-E2 ATPase
VVFLAATISLAGIAWLWSGDPIRAVAVLVVATPCPLILAVPIAIVSGLSRAAKQGILIKGGKALEMLAQVRALVIDKTGTLTHGRARILSTSVTSDVSPDELLRLAASLDQASKHIIAQTIVDEARARRLDLTVPGDVTEMAGVGIEGNVDGRKVIVGGVRFVTRRVTKSNLASLGSQKASGAVTVAVALDGSLAGILVLADELRAGTEALLRNLRSLGIERIVLATAPPRDVARNADRVLDQPGDGRGERDNRCRLQWRRVFHWLQRRVHPAGPWGY